jgi:hypothetical protein
LERKTEKRFELLKWYLLKICDEGHHTRTILELSDRGEEKYCQGLPITEPEDAKIVIINEYDSAFSIDVKKNLAELIQRDIDLYWRIENLRIREAVSIEKARMAIEENWPKKLGSHLGKHAIKEIYKFYAGIFRLKKGEDPSNFPFAEAASYKLRKSKVLRGWYFINNPVGIFADIHRMLDIPREKDIENEIPIYQEARNRAFGVTFAYPLRLLNQSMGFFKGRFENRPEKIKDALTYVTKKYEYNFEKMITIYHHYRLIEAEENGLNQGKIYKRLESDFKSISH